MGIFGAGKKDLIEALLLAWDTIAEARGERIRFHSHDGGFDIGCAVLREDIKGQEWVHVFTFHSFNAAKSFLEQQKSATKFHDHFVLIKASRPWSIIEYNLGNVRFDEWVARMAP